jgi:heparan-alpha-glucosaminide N-acetyltransferase
MNNQPSLSSPRERIASIDAFRGLVMLLMMAEVLHLTQVAGNFPGNSLWQWLGYHQSHVQWFGCSLHDLIQPSFSFLVGVALPFSIASRVARGQSTRKMFGHTVWRALLLILLGILLRSVDRDQTHWTFEDTLAQIGLGYPFLFLLGLRSFRTHLIALGVILGGYWLAWAFYPLPGPGFDYAAAGASADWPQHAQGFAAHWNKHLNLGAAFDRWFLNLFPQPDPFVRNVGGYLTLSFIPTLGTMILGLFAGSWLKAELSPKARLKRLLLASVICFVLGGLLHQLGICPIVKRIWTPSWVLFSGGWCFLFMAVLYAVIDWRGLKKWAFPLIVIGMNSIAAYLIAHLIQDFTVSSFRTHLGPGFFALLGENLEPFLEGVAVLATYWLILFWMYRRKLFLRI